MKTPLNHPAGCAILLAMVTGCTTGKVDMPDLEVPDTFRYGGSSAGMAQTASSEGEPWWSIFGSPELDRLMQRIAENNPGYDVALNRIEEARLQAEAVRTLGLPRLEYGFLAERNKFSGAGAGFNSGRIRNSFEAPLTLRYEVDAWGRIRQAVNAGKADTAAFEADAATLLLSLQAELAARYLQLQALHTEDGVLERAVAVRRKALDLTRARFEAGDVSEIDVSLAETELAEVRAEQIGLHRGRIALVNTIATLVGIYPADLEVSVLPLAPEPPTIGPGFPADLVRRRPDIQAAENRLQGELARLGVARTLWFPRIMLDGSVGFEADEVGDLGSSDSETWRGGAILTGPLFDAGANRIEKEIADVGVQLEMAAYREAVLEAFRESETALAAIGVLDEQIEALQDTVQAARRTVALTEKQYKAGLVDYFEVVNAQRTLLRNEQAATLALSQRYQALIQLIKALGGGWRPVFPLPGTQ